MFFSWLSFFAQSLDLSYTDLQNISVELDKLRFYVDASPPNITLVKTGIERLQSFIQNPAYEISKQTARFDFEDAVRQGDLKELLGLLGKVPPGLTCFRVRDRSSSYIGVQGAKKVRIGRAELGVDDELPCPPEIPEGVKWTKLTVSENDGELRLNLENTNNFACVPTIEAVSSE
jgi:hypothetical protein